LLPYLVWLLAIFVLNLNAATFFLAAHDDSPETLAALPAYDFYHTGLLSGGWAIAVIDELRGCPMRW
jgi:hypothetical protein